MRKAIVMAMVALLALTLVAPAASAKAEHMPASWLQATCAVSGGEVTTTEGSEHLRSEVHRDVIFMYLSPQLGYVEVGSNDILFNYDLGLANFNGRGGGTFDVDVDLTRYGIPFAWTGSGHFNGQIKAGMLRAHVVGYGTDESDGDRLTGTIQQFKPSGEQLDWMCGGETVYKAVAVTASIIDK